MTYAAAVVAMEITFNWALSRRLGRHRRHPEADAAVGPAEPCPAAAAPSSGRWRLRLLVLTVAFIHRFRRSRLGLAALMVQMNPDLRGDARPRSAAGPPRASS